MERAEIKKYLETVRYHYFNVKGGGHVCVATVNNQTRDKMFFGASFFTPKDRFSKVKGRMEAYKRLYQGMKTEDLFAFANKKPEVNESTMALWFLEMSSNLCIFPNWLEKQVRYNDVTSVISPRRLPKIKKPLVKEMPF